MKISRKLPVRQAQMHSPQLRQLSYSTRVSPQHLNDSNTRRMLYGNQETPKISKIPNNLFMNVNEPQTDQEMIKVSMTSPVNQQINRRNRSQRQSPKNSSFNRDKLQRIYEMPTVRYGDNDSLIKMIMGKNPAKQLQRITQNVPKVNEMVRTGFTNAQVSKVNPPSDQRSQSQQKQRNGSAKKATSKSRNLSIQQNPDNTQDDLLLFSKDQTKTNKNTSFFSKPHNFQIDGIDEYFEYVLRYAIRTQRGYLPNNPNKINQDNYILCPNIGKKSYQHFFSVCDGHGMNGHFVSGFLKQFFPVLLNSKRDYLESNPEGALRLAFQILSQKLNTESQIDLTFSGSTVVAVFLLHNKLYCANLGDSRALLAKRIHDQWQAVPLSRDHKPNEPAEHDRIVSCGGRIEPFRDQLGNHIGPMRVWTRHENVPGLAMSRSMGDLVAASVGVSQDPEIKEFTLSQEDKMIIIGSDGVWEFFENEEVVSLLTPFYERNDLEGACETLLQQAHDRWVQNCSVIDDITFIIIFMSY